MLIQTMLKQKGPGVITINPQASIAEAVTALAEHHIGALVVSKTGKSIDGILSERDIVRCMAQPGADTLALTVAQLMTSKVQTCGTETTIAELMEMMTENKIRHVPIAVEGELVGLVSIGDVVSARLNELEQERKHIEEYITS